MSLSLKNAKSLRSSVYEKAQFVHMRSPIISMILASNDAECAAWQLVFQVITLSMYRKVRTVRVFGRKTQILGHVKSKYLSTFLILLKLATLQCQK